jgi:hypothetical protein
MILKPKPIDQKSDAELAQDFKKAAGLQAWLLRNNKHVNHGIAVGLFAGGYFTAKALCTIGFATGNLPLLLLGFVSAPAIWAGGAVGSAFGWARLSNNVHNGAQNKKNAIVKELDDRAFKKTPAYKELLHRAHEEAIRAKQALKDAFNTAVDKVFHGGTDKTVQVKKPLQLKKPGEQPPKKKLFGLSR